MKRGGEILMGAIVLFSILIISPLISATSLVSFSDQGTDVHITETGELLSSGNLTIDFYSSPTEATLIYEQNFTDAIVNGSWNVVLTGFPADFGKTYYKDYIINGDNLNFDGEDRLEFMSPLGELNIASNISLGQKITFLFGEVIDNIADGWLTLTGNLNVRGQGNFSGTIYINNGTDISTLGNSSWNQNYANGLYSGITWNYNQTTPAINHANLINSSALHISDLPLENRTRIHCSNITGASSNLCTVTGAGGETDPAWSANFTTMQIECPTGYYSYGISSNGSLKCREETVGTGGENASWNESYANTLYTNKTGYNTTQFESLGGMVHIVESWFSTTWDNLFRNFFNQNLNTTSNTVFNRVNLTSGYICNSTNCFSLSELNSSSMGGDFSNYYTKFQTDQNLTLYLRLTDQRFNETNLVLAINVTAKDKFNSTYAEYITFNLTSFKQNLTLTDCTGTDKVVGIADNGTVVCGIVEAGVGTNCDDGHCVSVFYWANQSYLNETDLINSVNTTLNIQQLYNTTTSMIANNSINQRINRSINQYLSNANASYLTTYNATYAGYADNVSRNWTQITFDTYNTTWDDVLTGQDVNASINIYLSRANASYLSTYNASYASFNNTLNIQQLYNLTASLTANFSVNDFLNKTINLYLSGANSSYLTTYNATYHSFISNVSRNWTLDVYNNWNTFWLSTYNASYHGYPANWNTTINQYLINANASYLSTYNATYAANMANSSWNESYANTLYTNKTGYNTTQFESVGGMVHIVESWFSTAWDNLFRNFFNQNLNTTDSPNFAEINITGGYIWNGSDRFSFTDLNTTGSSTGGMSSSEVNVTINVYLTNANASYLSTYNVTYGGYPSNWNSSINQYLTNANASYLTTYNASYHGYPANWNTTINQYLISANASYLSTYNASYHGYPANWNTTINQYLISANASYLTTYNASYESYRTNVSKNWTEEVYNTYSAGWGGAPVGGGLSNYSNYSNYSYHWGNNVNSTNTTQITVNNGVLTILESWLRTLFGSFQNSTKLDIRNITSIATCSGTDKSKYNGTDFICDADQTGVGGGGRVLYELRTNATTRNNTHYNQTVFTMPILAYTNYTFECNLFVAAVNATTGVQLNVTIPASPYLMSVWYMHPTTATTSGFVHCSDTDNLRQCLSASTASLTAGLPVEVKGRVLNGANAGNIEISMKSELLSAWVVVRRGSYCFIESEVAV